MLTSSFRLFAAVSLSVVLLAAAAWATQRGEGGTATLSKLTSVERVADHSRLAGEPVRRAREALKRAADARTAGDRHHAGLLEAVGLEWARTAEVLVRAAAVEQRADQAQRKANEAKTQAIRAQALLEETTARRGRSRAMLEQMMQEAAEAAEGGEAP